MIVIENKSIRNFFRISIPVMFIPLTIFIGTTLVSEKKHLIISFSVVLLSLLFFISGIEKKNIGTRRLVIVSAMTALCVVGRFIPFFQPITALTIITAIYLGGESGFMVGASAAFISNFYFGQGPWTPFQMFSWGCIGLIAGLFSKQLVKSKFLLVLFGVLSGVLYSMIMDVWSTLIYNGSFSLQFYIATVITAFPHTVLYSVSNFIFLFFCSNSFGKKLNRIKIKYGI